MFIAVDKRADIMELSGDLKTLSCLRIETVHADQRVKDLEG